MDQAVPVLDMTGQDREIVETIGRERNRLRNFIRKRVGDIDDAEDVLQDVFFGRCGPFEAGATGSGAE
jgi:DNA-directed RNA polymerase specialized sigma24 family protein